MMMIDVAPVKKCFRSSSSEENKKTKSMMIGDDTLFLGLWLSEITPDLYKGKAAFGDKRRSVTNWGSLWLYDMIFDG
ncbi:hypothetical protein Tco_0268833 [Tanacetum coccineum]